MEPSTQETVDPSGSIEQLKENTSGFAFRRLLPLGIFAVAILVLVVLVATKPKPKKKDDAPQGTLVEIEKAKLASEQVVVKASGLVRPARSIVLSPEVAAKVRKVHPDFVPGGFIKEGERMVWLNAVDYQLVVEQTRAQVQNARTQLQLEQGNKEVAEQDLQLLGKSETASALARREPQLQAAEAQLKAAMSGLKIARRNAGKTILSAPFNAQVQTESVDPGQLVSPGMQMAVLVGTDAYWIQVSVPPDALARIKVPRGDEPGAEVTIFQDTGSETIVWQGRVIKALPDIDPVGRMARVLIEVKDPLELEKPEAERRPIHLLINDYVEVEIDAGTVAQAIKVPRNALRNGRTVFVMNKEDKLEIRPIKLAWRDRRYVLVSEGLKDGERMVVTPVATPVNGLKLRLYEPSFDETKTAEKPKKDKSKGAPTTTAQGNK